MKEDIEKEIKRIRSRIKELNGELDKLEAIEEDVKTLRAQVEEIESVGLKEDEERELEERRRQILDRMKIRERREKALKILSEGEGSIHYMVKKAIEILGDDHKSELENINLSIRELSSKLSREALAVKEDELKRIEERISLVRELKKKYGRTEGEVLKRLREAKRRLEELSGFEKKIESITEEIEKLEDKARDISKPFLKELADVFVPKEEEEERRRTAPFLLTFLLLWLVLGQALSRMEVPKEISPEELQRIPERFAKIIAPEIVKEKFEAKKEIEGVKTKVAKKKKERGKGGKSAKAGDRKEQIRKKVRTKGILGIITAKGRKGALAEILHGGAIADLDEVLGKITGLGVARAGIKELARIGKGFGVGGGGRTTDIGALAARGGEEVGLGGKKVARVRTSITTEAPDITGEIDEGTVRRVALRHMAAIKYCYEKALIRDPNAKGKIVVRITIGQTGRVVEADIESSTIKDAEMLSCILRMVRRWRFPNPKGGEVVVTYPFVFVAST